MTYRPHPSDWRGLTRTELREEAKHRRNNPGDEADDMFFGVYWDRGLGDTYFDWTTRGLALDVASRFLLKAGETAWSWARTERDTNFWLVTFGNRDHALYQVDVWADRMAVASWTVL